MELNSFARKGSGHQIVTKFQEYYNKLRPSQNPQKIKKSQSISHIKSGIKYISNSNTLIRIKTSYYSIGLHILS